MSDCILDYVRDAPGPAARAYGAGGGCAGCAGAPELGGCAGRGAAEQAPGEALKMGGCAECGGEPRAPHAPEEGTYGGRRRKGADRADNVAALDAEALAALEGLTTSTEECAEDVERAPGAPCASRRVTRAVFAFASAVEAPAPAPAAPGSAALPTAPAATLPAAATPEAEAVRAAAAALGCASESCVLTSPVFRQFVVEKQILPPAALELELATRFKAKGPRNSLALLSNFNIDETLQRWARIFPEFFPCPFAMIDFDRSGEPFATIDLSEVLAGREPLDLGPGFGVVRRPASCFGCVVNTDSSSGPGKHWVAVFVDCRPPPGAPWTVEYFNSAGRPPGKPVCAWMERSRARLADYRARLPGAAGGEVVSVPVTDMDHQESQTECGLYAMFYIRRRLEGTPFSFFFRQRIPDKAMTAFRQHVFRLA
jgi:hypothetical protein